MADPKEIIERQENVITQIAKEVNYAIQQQRIADQLEMEYALLDANKVLDFMIDLHPSVGKEH